MFDSLADENRHLRHWEATVADKRLHGTTKRQVAAAFAEERPHLKSLPVDLFPCFEEGQRRVHRDGHVEVAKAYYSVPVEYRHREVWVRWDARFVRIYSHRFEPVTVHARAEEGRFSTVAGHIPPQKISSIERGSEWMMRRAEAVGPHCAAWARAMLENRGLQGIRVLQGLLGLIGKHHAKTVEAGCKKALTHELFRLRDLRQLLGTTEEQPQLAFLEQHPLIRDMTAYGQLVPFSSDNKGNRKP